MRRLARRLNSILHGWRPRIQLAGSAMIWPGAKLRMSSGLIRIGARTQVFDGALIDAQSGLVEIGEDCTINPYVTIMGKCGVSIGDGCRIASHAVIVSGNHGMDPNSPMRQQPVTGVGVIIGSDVWIGAGVIVLDGAIVPDGCVLAAGAVVRPGQMERLGVYGGVPARLLKFRGDSPRERPTDDA